MIFGAKKVGNTGEWIKLHNAELHALFLRLLRWAGRVARSVWSSPEMHIEF